MFVGREMFDEALDVVSGVFKDLMGKGVSVRKHFALGRLKVLYCTCYYKVPRAKPIEEGQEGESEYPSP